MKHMKKLLSLAMALAMVLALGVSASAANGKTHFIVPDNEHTYTLYKVFDASLADSTSLKDFDWNESQYQPADLY